MMLAEQATLHVTTMLQDAPHVSTLLLVVIAILLVILFIWLLLRERSAQEATVRDAAAREAMARDAAARAAAAREAAIRDATEREAAAREVAASTAKTGPLAALPAVEKPVAEMPVAEMPSVEMPQVTPIPETKSEDIAAPVVEMPATAAAPVMDDLKIIEGIGPKIASVLNQAGVTSFAQLAAMEPDSILAILKAAKLRLADPHSWPKQAGLAAAGDMTALKELQDHLKGGREV